MPKDTPSISSPCPSPRSSRRVASIYEMLHRYCSDDEMGPSNSGTHDNLICDKTGRYIFHSIEQDAQWNREAAAARSPRRVLNKRDLPFEARGTTIYNAPVSNQPADSRHRRRKTTNSRTTSASGLAEFQMPTLLTTESSRKAVLGLPIRHRGDATLLPSADLEQLDSEEGLSSLDFEMSSEEATRLYDSELDMEILRSLSSSPTLVGSPRASSPDSKATKYKGYTVPLEGMDMDSKLRSYTEADPFSHDAWDAQLQHIFEQYINIEECCDT